MDNNRVPILEFIANPKARGNSKDEVLNVLSLISGFMYYLRALSFSRIMPNRMAEY
jgi:hypothetical protein